MENRKYQKGRGPADEDSSSEEMTDEIIGTKELYNWLYQQEEEDYYLNADVPCSSPDFSQQEQGALFVEY